MNDGKLIILNLDDWVGVFIDDHLEYEGHSIEPSDLLDLLGIPYENHWYDDKDSKYHVVMHNALHEGRFYHGLDTTHEIECDEGC